MSEIYALRAGGEIRYVGKTTGTGQRRLSDHWRNSRRGVGRQRRLSSWLRSLAEPPEVVVLERDPSGGLDEAERSWIASLLLYGCRLTNMTPGGDGQPKGYVPSRQSRERVSRSLRAKPPRGEAWRARLSSALMGHEVSAETRAKISAQRRKHGGAKYARDLSTRERDECGRFARRDTSQLAGSTT